VSYLKGKQEEMGVWDQSPGSTVEEEKLGKEKENGQEEGDRYDQPEPSLYPISQPVPPGQM
jgi:hypothetical protein